jgi:hypothetical protein
MPKIVKDNHDGTFTVYSEKEWLQRRTGTGISILLIVLCVFIYFFVSNLLNTKVIKDFGFGQYISNFTHFYGGDRCVWIAGDTELNTGTSFNLYESPDINSRVVKELSYPIMVKYRGKDSSEYTEVTEHSTYTRPVRWSAVTIYNDVDIKLNGYMDRGLDYSVHESHHFATKENLVNVYSSDFARHYNFDNKKLRGNRYALRLDVLCNPSLVENVN